MGLDGFIMARFRSGVSPRGYGNSQVGHLLLYPLSFGFGYVETFLPKSLGFGQVVSLVNP